MRSLPRISGILFIAISLLAYIGAVNFEGIFSYFSDREASQGNTFTAATNDPPEVSYVSTEKLCFVWEEVTIRWHAIDPDGDELTIDLYFSNDDGGSWFPLPTTSKKFGQTDGVAENLPNKGEYKWYIPWDERLHSHKARIKAVAKEPEDTPFGPLSGEGISDEFLSINRPPSF